MSESKSKSIPASATGMREVSNEPENRETTPCGPASVRGDVLPGDEGREVCHEADIASRRRTLSGPDRHTVDLPVAQPCRRVPLGIADRVIRAVRCDVVPFSRRRRPAVRGDELEATARRLEASGRYRVLRRLASRSVDTRPLGTDARLLLLAHSRPDVPKRRGSQLDNATVILASYDDEGLKDVVAVLEGQPQGSFTFSGSARLAATGTLEVGAFDAFAGRIHLCVSHDGGPLPDALRSRFPSLRALPWARTREAVDWRRLGVDGDGLASILARFGLFADVETPREGCEALVEALSAGRWPLIEDPPFAQIRHRMDERRVEVVATGPTYAIRDELKIRGYRWNRGVGGTAGCWTLVCPYRSALMEVAWLRHRLHAQGGSAEMRELI